jgi:hypothetical protein
LQTCVLIIKDIRSKLKVRWYNYEIKN